jgi:hypothetical protein
VATTQEDRDAKTRLIGGIVLSASAAFLLLLSGLAIDPGTRADAALVRAADTMPVGSLRAQVMTKFHSMNDAGNGIFSDDISAAVAKYFPHGQPLKETERVIQQQDLGHLQPFKGSGNPGDGAMYVTRFSLMSGTFSEVYVVLNFEFAGKTRDDMVVKKAMAFIRGSNM